MSRLPSLNALRAFEAAARHESLTKAAEELHVTPAAISHQLKALEADLGMELFDRRNRKLEPTRAALAAMPILREGFDRLAEAASLLREKGGSDLLTISVAPSLAAAWLLPRLDRFAEKHPTIDVRLDANLGIVDFWRDDVDVAIRYGPGEYPGLHAVRLFDEEVFPVCSPERARCPTPLRTPEDLRHHTLLHLDWSSQAGEWPDWPMWLRAAGYEHIDASRGPRFKDGAFLMQAARNGHGVALGSSAVLADDLAAGRLVRPFELGMLMRFAYWIACPEESKDKPKVVAMRDWLLDEAGRAGDDPAA